MNVQLLNLLAKSKISNEVLVALDVICTNRAAVTPAIMKSFVGWSEPIVPLSDTERNTAILSMLSHYELVTYTIGATS